MENTKVNVSWTFGNFDVSCAVTASGISGENAGKVVEGYALQIMQRKPASATEKSLAGYDKRPEGFKRDSIEYNEARAATVKSGFTLDLGNGVASICETVTQHVKGEVADSKFTEESTIVGRHESAGDLDKWLAETVKFAGASHGEDGEFSLEMLRAVRQYKIAKLAELRADI